MFSCGNSSDKLAVGKAEKLAGGFRFTEGPAVDKEGNVIKIKPPEEVYSKQLDSYMDYR